MTTSNTAKTVKTPAKKVTVYVDTFLHGLVPVKVLRVLKSSIDKKLNRVVVKVTRTKGNIKAGTELILSSTKVVEKAAKKNGLQHVKTAAIVLDSSIEQVKYKSVPPVFTVYDFLKSLSKKGCNVENSPV